jgi:NAD(P)-dependent dehydrogenase (short-subunit alcohol dehydrogenase family)
VTSAIPQPPDASFPKPSSTWRIDTLVNNAGIYIGKPFTKRTAEDCAAVMNVNMVGFHHITQLAIAELLVVSPRPEAQRSETISEWRASLTLLSADARTWQIIGADRFNRPFRVFGRAGAHPRASPWRPPSSISGAFYAIRRDQSR